MALRKERVHVFCIFKRDEQWGKDPMIPETSIRLHQRWSLPDNR